MSLPLYMYFLQKMSVALLLKRIHLLACLLYVIALNVIIVQVK